MYNTNEMIGFIDSLANGIDPKTGELLNDDTIVNRSDVIRMFFSIREFIKENNKVKKINKIPFVLTDTTDLYEKTITISQFVKKINEKNVSSNMKKLSYKAILAWLLKNGYLEIVGKSSKLATEKGHLYGMTNVEKFGKYGRYVVVEYNEDAQKMIIDKLLSGEINPEDKEYILEEVNDPL